MNVRKFFENLPDKVIDKHNVKQFEAAGKEHQEFLDALRKDCCYMCGMKLSYFHPSEQCLHWLLLPDGIRKNHLTEYLNEAIGFFQIESYLRWIANTEAPFKNINDLPNENPDGKILETTIKYRDIEWSLNFGKTDLEGHQNSQNASFPHFHFQIYKGGRPFIRFNDCHIPFSKRDLFLLEAIENEDLVQHGFVGGDGISAILNDDQLELIDQNMIPAVSEADATFHTRSIIKFPEDTNVTEEDIVRLKKESVEKEMPLRRYLKEAFPTIEIISITSPGKGVIEKKGRKPRK